MIEAGAPIAVVAPCGAYHVERFEQGLQIAREHGLNPVPLPGILQPWRTFAGTDSHRLDQLVEALCSEDFAATWIARGGYGVTRILDQIPWDQVAPRPVIGFSDVTALFCGLQRNQMGIAVHGPVVHSLPISDEASIRALVEVLHGGSTGFTGTSWVGGRATGPLVGGNLCLLAATAGTPDQLDARGSILVLEEVGEPAYRVDRMLQQLHSAGIFDGVRAVVLGEFVSCRVPEGADWSLDEMLLDHLRPLGVPVLAHAPIGHGSANHAFVWGSEATVDGDQLHP